MSKPRFTLQEADLRISYRSGADDLATEFYEQCLTRSKTYWRAAGYFSSSIFLITGPEILRFSQRGGQIRLICSPCLSSGDIEKIRQGYTSREDALTDHLSTEVAELSRDRNRSYPLAVLSTLIKFGILEIRIGLKGQGAGIYHEKLGLFKDAQGNIVSFIGSANETFYAWSNEGNVESIETFKSWVGDGNDRTQRHARDFDDLWNNRAKGIIVLPIPQAIERGLLSIAHNDLSDIDIDKALESLKKTTNISQVKKRNLLPHQANAIEAWEINKCRGILKHATGSGKTFTALSIVKDHASKHLPSLIIVPSKILLQQWQKEIRDEIPEANILLVGGGNSLWARDGIVEAMLAEQQSSEPSILLATIQTASTEGFLKRIRRPDNILLVADEVHQTGSDRNKEIYNLNAGKRLGLSATPERYGDPSGTKEMLTYFGAILEPVVSLYDAINSGRLVNYEYHPEVVRLTGEENERWKLITKEIRKEVARTNKEGFPFIVSDRAKLLLIQRSRISKKAIQKIDVAAEILVKHKKKGEHWLVYCEDIDQLVLLRSHLLEIGIESFTYYSEMPGDPQETLEAYKRLGGILLSIKCLDEGVDIPVISHALILASSQNPRQFIQRRGRVLRADGVKLTATLYDTFVVPESLDEDLGQESLLRTELTRAYEFSRHAVNIDSGFKLREIANRFGFDLNVITNAGIEED